MAPGKFTHLFVCTNTTGSGKPTCGQRGGAAFAMAVQQKLLARGATNVTVTPCGCLGPCFDGPNAVVYPDGIWYAGLDEKDADGVIAHLVDGVVYAAKRTEPPGQS